MLPRLALLSASAALLVGCPINVPICGFPPPFTPGPPAVQSQRGVRTRVSLSVPTATSACGTPRASFDSGFTSPAVVTVTDPANVPVPHEVVEDASSAHVTFTPDRAGTWFVRVNFEPNRGSAFLFVNVAEPIALDGGRKLSSSPCEKLTSVAGGLLCDNLLHFPDGSERGIVEAVPGSAQVIWSIGSLDRRIRRHSFPEDGGATETSSLLTLPVSQQVLDELADDGALHVMTTTGLHTAVPADDGGLRFLPVVPKGPGGALDGPGLVDAILLAGHGRLFVGRLAFGSSGAEWGFCEVLTSDAGVRTLQTSGCAIEAGGRLGRTRNSVYIGDSLGVSLSRLHVGPAGIERLRMLTAPGLLPVDSDGEGVPTFRDDAGVYLPAVGPEGLFLQLIPWPPPNVRATEEFIWTWHRTDELDVFVR